MSQRTYINPALGITVRNTYKHRGNACIEYIPHIDKKLSIPMPFQSFIVTITYNVNSTSNAKNWHILIKNIRAKNHFFALTPSFYIEI